VKRRSGGRLRLLLDDGNPKVVTELLHEGANVTFATFLIARVAEEVHAQAAVLPWPVAP
jgi:hypothetical protein